MAELARLKTEIAGLAGHRKTVRMADIERIVGQLAKLGYETKSKTVRHGTLFKVADQTFQVSAHSKSGSYVLKAYVDNFLEAMLSLGLLDEE